MVRARRVRRRSLHITTGFSRRPLTTGVPELELRDEVAHRGGLRGGLFRGGRQLLVFSDSRQDAAFFAPYLSRTYSQILRRRLILQTLEEHRERALANRWRLQDLITPLKSLAGRLGILAGMSQQEQEGEAQPRRDGHHDGPAGRHGEWRER